MHSELATYLETRVGVKLKIESLGSSKRGKTTWRLEHLEKVVKAKERVKVKEVRAKGKKIKEKVRVKACQRMEKVPMASLAQIRQPWFVSTAASRDTYSETAEQQNRATAVATKAKEKEETKVRTRVLTTWKKTLGLAMLGATSEDERPAEGEQPVPDVGLPEATRKAAQRRYRRQLKAGTRLTWRDLPVTRYRQRLAASIDAARTVKGSVAVGQWIAKKVLEREYLGDACSSGDERSKPSTVAAMEYATKRAQAKRMSSGAYDVLREETEEESDDVEDSGESEDEEVQEQSESPGEEEEEPKEEDIEIEQEDEDEGEEADDEGADEYDKRQEEYLRAYAETSADEESREKILGILAEARALLDEGQMPAMKKRNPRKSRAEAQRERTRFCLIQAGL